MTRSEVRIKAGGVEGGSGFQIKGQVRAVIDINTERFEEFGRVHHGSALSGSLKIWKSSKSVVEIQCKARAKTKLNFVVGSKVNYFQCLRYFLFRA